jgi:hypothetical protein
MKVASGGSVASLGVRLWWCPFIISSLLDWRQRSLRVSAVNNCEEPIIACSLKFKIMDQSRKLGLQ